MVCAKAIDTKQVRALLRTMYFSNDTIDHMLEDATADQIDAILEMIEFEVGVRERRKRQKLLRRAHFPQIKSFDGYDFSEVVLPEGYTKDELVSLAFMESAQDFVFHGQTGRGKTHLAIAIGVECVHRGKSVRFFTAAELVMALEHAKRECSLETFLKDIYRSELLIIDELGYVPLSQESSRLLFQVMSDCYERRSLVITTNIEFSKWGIVFGDDKLASAIIDRIMHHGRLVEFNGKSKRLEHSLMLGKQLHQGSN